MKAIVTGCHGDIGYAICQKLVAKKYYLYALDKHISRVAADQHHNIQIVPIDLAESSQVSSVMQAIQEPVDVLVYAAGIREIIPATELNLTDWHEVMNVNLNSAFIVAQHAIRLALKKQRPLCIIFISSISGLQGESERSAYCASKHGLIGLAKSLALEYAENAIRVNVISPGIIETGMTRTYQNQPRIMQQLDSHIPLKKWGQPHHIVQAVNFIIDNDYLTGSTLVIDGGWMAGKEIKR